MSQVVQINCPNCQAPAPRNDTNEYECEYCFHPFSVVDAQREDGRLLDEIKAWLQKSVGDAAMSGSGVDASSRAYIFQEKILPTLRRDTDRVLEVLGDYGQFSLVSPPVPVEASKARHPNPLVHSRSQILGLKGLRARLCSAQVSQFAVTDDDRSHIQKMDRRVTGFMHLSNVAEAAARRSAAGYASARKNLEALIEELDRSLATEGTQDQGLAAFLGATKERYQALIELCRISEELTSPNPPSGQALLERLAGVRESLHRIARTIENMDYDPAQTMLVVIGVDLEVSHCDVLARWINGYEALAGRRSLSFAEFIRQVDPVVGGSQTPALVKADMMESCTELVRAARGEITAVVSEDFSWVDSWVENARKKKWLCFFGVEETVASVEQFLVPMWVAEVSYSKAQGAVLKEGVQDKCLAAVDACSPDASRVRFFTGPDAQREPSMNQQGTLGTTPIALPSAPMGTALRILQQAAKKKQGMLNPNVRMQGLAYLPAAVVQFESSNGSRQLAWAIDGGSRLEPATWQNVEAAKQILSIFR